MDVTSPSTTPDRLRWIALAALALCALLGRRHLTIDIENLAMKSGSDAAVEALREREFDTNPHILFMIAGHGGPLTTWQSALAAHPQVTAARLASEQPRVLDLAIARTPDRRYAASIQALTTLASQSLPTGYTLSSTGSAVIELAISDAMQAEQARILPLIAAALAIVLWLVYRSSLFAVVALFAPLLAVLTLEGLQGFLGIAVDPISGLLGPTLLTIGVAASVHVLERFRDQLKLTDDAFKASANTAASLRLPLALTVATTVAGFLGLATSPIPAVRRFGALAALGVTLVVVLVWCFVPWLLARYGRRAAPGQGFRRAPALTRDIFRARHAIVGATLVAGAAGLLHLGTSSVDSNPLHVLHPNDPARIAAERIADQLGGSDGFDVLLEPRAGVTPLVRNFAALQLIERIASLPGIARPTDVPRFSDAGYGLLSFLLVPSGSAARETLFAQVEATAAEAGWPGAHATGLAVGIARDSNQLVGAQRQGLGYTLIALFVVMALGFRSLPLGLLGLLPNVLPLVLIQGWRGFHSTPLSVASSMIAVVMLGLVVDDTIHWLHAFRVARGTTSQRVTVAMTRVTRPILITTLVLSVGFAMTFFGALWSTREFGQLAVATLVIALIADLVILPAFVLLLFKPSATHA